MRAIRFAKPLWACVQRVFRPDDARLQLDEVDGALAGCARGGFEVFGIGAARHGQQPLDRARLLERVEQRHLPAGG